MKAELWIETTETIMSIPLEAKLSLNEYPFFLRYIANSKDDVSVSFKKYATLVLISASAAACICAILNLKNSMTPRTVQKVTSTINAVPDSIKRKYLGVLHPPVWEKVKEE